MRILHLFSNWKWTGPAEPALNLAWQQSSDHDVLFISGTPQDGLESRIEPQAKERGVPIRGGLHLSKHASFRLNREDARRLGGLLAEFQPDVVHTHMENDHRIASMAAARQPVGVVVRTAYDPLGLSGSLRTRRTARRALDGLIVTTSAGLEGTLASYGGAPAAVKVAGRVRPMALIEGGIDLVRFDPRRFDRDEQRAALGLAPDEVAVGIVARVQGHRRFDMLLDAFSSVARRHAELRLVVIGRGTRIQPLLLDPVEKLGLAGRVLATGYRSGEEFPAALAALDASLFLVPGTDGTCRALREQMAMGLPSLVTRRPPLPDIVEANRTGLVVEESAAGLEQGLETLVTDAARRTELGRGARDAAERRFDLARQYARVMEFYGLVLKAAGEPRRGAVADGEAAAG